MKGRGHVICLSLLFYAVADRHTNEVQYQTEGLPVSTPPKEKLLDCNQTRSEVCETWRAAAVAVVKV